VGAYFCFFVFVFLGIAGALSVVSSLAAPDKKRRRTIVRPCSCDDVEYKVRTALKSSSEVIVIIPDKMRENREFAAICKALIDDYPSVRCVSARKRIKGKGQ